ncbi:prepilin peptidase [Paenibacillus sp. GXUN7292]|uniref:prepilin peptidase n=1 Tax=Paenibacillus sp. GXUN7292 TaxID=3422499 RepID=UPI003D7C9FA3
MMLGAAAVTILLLYFSYTDFRYKILPNKLMYPALSSISIYRLFIHDDAIWTYFATGGIAGGLFLLVALINPKWIGGGDVKLLAFLGIALGWELMVIATLIFSIAGFIFSLFTGFLKRTLRKIIPLGPFIALGGIAALWFGNSFLEWLYTLFTTAYKIV